MLKSWFLGYARFCLLVFSLGKSGFLVMPCFLLVFSLGQLFTLLFTDLVPFIDTKARAAVWMFRQPNFRFNHATDLQQLLKSSVTVEV